MTATPIFRSVARVLASLPDDLEAMAHARFRALGGNSSRWQRRDWRALADAIVEVEDRVEAECPRFDRSALRNARRALEVAAELARAA